MVDGHGSGSRSLLGRFCLGIPEENRGWHDFRSMERPHVGCRQQIYFHQSWTNLRENQTFNTPTNAVR
eukprot:1181896-Prorocentrum_minimum.AAC.2